MSSSLDRQGRIKISRLLITFCSLLLSITPPSEERRSNKARIRLASTNTHTQSNRGYRRPTSKTMSSSLDRQGHIKISRLLITWTLFCSFISLCSAVIVTVSVDGHAVEGQQTRLICTIEKSDPNNRNTPLITWQEVVDGSPVTIVQYQNTPGTVAHPYEDRFSIEGDDSQLILVIDNTMQSDDGTYQCEVNLFDDSPTPASDDVTISVAYLDKPVLSSFATPVYEGNMVEISCSVDANPPLYTYTFKKDGVVQQEGGSSALTFQSVSRSDDGSYECEASNSAAIEISDSRMLEVYYAPEITPLSNMQVSPGDEVVIRFDVDAKPAAIYVWTTTPATTDTDSNQDAYTFTVSDNINETYTLMLNASNDVGATQASVEVTVVVGLPVPTSTSITSTTATVCLCDDCAGSNTGLVVGMTFLGIFIGILLSSSVFVVLGKMKNSKAQLTEATSRNDTQPAAYMAYRGDPNAENQTYQDLQRNDDDNPVVYVNVKVKKEKR